MYPDPTEPDARPSPVTQKDWLPPDWERLPLSALDLHALFRFAPPTQEGAKTRQHLLVKKLAEEPAYFTNINELSNFLDDRTYEHSNEAISQLAQLTGLELQELLISNGHLRIETGISLMRNPNEVETGMRNPNEAETGRVLHTIVYDKPKIKDILKEENRSNLTLLFFLLLRIQHHHTPSTALFKVVCDYLKPKLRTVDYGLLLNHLHQPCDEQFTQQERFNYYANSLKSAVVLLNYLMTHQPTQSVRQLHDAYYHFVSENIKADAVLDSKEKIALLKLTNLCFGYTRLTDKNIKASDLTLFTKTPKQKIDLLNALKKPLEEIFIFAEADPLNPRDTNQKVDTTLERCYQRYVDSLAQLQPQDEQKNEFANHAYIKLQEFDGRIAEKIREFKLDQSPT